MTHYKLHLPQIVRVYREANDIWPEFNEAVSKGAQTERGYSHLTFKNYNLDCVTPLSAGEVNAILYLVSLSTSRMDYEVDQVANLKAKIQCPVCNYSQHSLLTKMLDLHCVSTVGQ